VLFHYSCTFPCVVSFPIGVLFCFSARVDNIFWRGHFSVHILFKFWGDTLLMWKGNLFLFLLPLNLSGL